MARQRSARGLYSITVVYNRTPSTRISYRGPASAFSSPARYRGFVGTNYAGWHSLLQRRRHRLLHLGSLPQAEHQLPLRVSISLLAPWIDTIIILKAKILSRTGFETQISKFTTTSCLRKHLASPILYPHSIPFCVHMSAVHKHLICLFSAKLL